jgi:hypothetical protein
MGLFQVPTIGNRLSGIFQLPDEYGKVLYQNILLVHKAILRLPSITSLDMISSDINGFIESI